MHYIERQLWTAIFDIVTRIEEKGFKLSAGKTSCVHFCRRRGLHSDPILSINQSKIAVVDSAGFWGVTFDKKLT